MNATAEMQWRSPVYRSVSSLDAVLKIAHKAVYLDQSDWIYSAKPKRSRLGARRSGWSKRRS